MKRSIIYYICMLLLAACLAGCGKTAPPPQAGLAPQSGEAEKQWRLPEAVRSQGEGNLYRIVTGSSLGAPHALELAASGGGQLEYILDAAAGPEVVAEVRLLFLSTQGTGRISLAALDREGRELARKGWVITGEMPQKQTRANWTDQRYNVNYKGDWLNAEYRPAEILAPLLAGIPSDTVGAYRFTVQAGQGQHVLVTRFALGPAMEKAVSVSPVTGMINAVTGETLRLEADIVNQTNHQLDELTVSLVEPYGYGLTSREGDKKVQHLQPGEKRRLSWEVTANRSHAVNLGKYWQVGFAIDGKPTSAYIQAAVTDNRPGKIFYVMTEDLEAIDSAGYGAVWGNRTGWLEPEELEVQMAHKAEKLNAIAEQYGAKWTHYIAWPLIKAAEWAAGQSANGDWAKAVARVRQSVQTEAAKGHEYAIHLHSDYDPYLPGNVLSYNAATNGLWANHLRHGWSHSLGTEGNLGDYVSRTGMLYQYQRIMDELSASSQQGQIITARVGSFDFGAGPESEAMSTRAYRKVGLWASSDADGNEGGITSGPYGQEIYFAKPDDINTPAVDLQSCGLVEFRPTPRNFINYDSQSAAVMNQLAEEGIRYFTGQDGSVNPGVHGIIGFTHAMFVMGQGDWKSTEQGQFAAIEDHLRYLKGHADQGKVIFGTASEMVKAWLDYYTPEPIALYGARLSQSGLGVSEYAITILGSHIPIDSQHAHKVMVKMPLYLRDSAYRAVILKNGQPVYSTYGLPTPDNDIPFTLDDKEAKYTLKVYHNQAMKALLRYFQAAKSRFMMLTAKI